MKPSHYYTSLALSVLCAVLSLTLFIMGSAARSLQSDLQKLQTQYQTQQEQINASVTIREQIVPNLFKDMASFPEDAAMKAILSKHGAPPTNP